MPSQRLASDGQIDGESPGLEYAASKKRWTDGVYSQRPRLLGNQVLHAGSWVHPFGVVFRRPLSTTDIPMRVPDILAYAEPLRGIVTQCPMIGKSTACRRYIGNVSIPHWSGQHVVPLKPNTSCTFRRSSEAREVLVNYHVNRTGWSVPLAMIRARNIIVSSV